MAENGFATGIHSAPMSVPLSVCIITKDEAARLPACLASVDFADEILVVDCGSEDETVAVAEAAGARVIHQDWLGYGPQKQFAVERASHDWVLCLDADERVSEPLKTNLLAALRQIEHGGTAGFAFPRRNRFLGRYLAHGEGYPDWSLRLFDRRRGRWSADPVHEGVRLNGPCKRLSGDLLHESQESLERYLQKQNRYTSLQARQWFERGKRAGALRLWLSPLLRFFKFYVLRLGFLDGVPGFVHIAIGCQNSFLKYAKLRELTAGRSGGVD